MLWVKFRTHRRRCCELCSDPTGVALLHANVVACDQGHANVVVHDAPASSCYLQLLQMYESRLIGPSSSKPAPQASQARQIEIFLSYPLLGFLALGEASLAGSFMPAMNVQQQLAYLQQKIVALGVATSSFPPQQYLGAAPFYPENLVTSFFRLNTRNYNTKFF